MSHCQLLLAPGELGKERLKLEQYRQVAELNQTTSLLYMIVDDTIPDYMPGQQLFGSPDGGQ